MNIHPGDDATVRAGGTGSPTRATRPLVCQTKGRATATLPAATAPVGSVSPAGATKGRFGAVKGQKPPRGKRVTTAEFKRMWFDPALTLDDIGRSLGICNRSVWQRAKHRGMPPRPTIIKPGPAPSLDEAAEDMWRACVLAEDIAAAYGVTVSTVHMHVHRKGVKRERKLSRWHPGISLDQYRQMKLGEALAERARHEQSARRIIERSGWKKAA